ncbi:SRR1-like protein [Varanus komodoensis]|uniref:SRR1-like protein n=1 Tax=Varanus komodoensis TaxID=61221 RepID=UPI001CF76AEA|nr:SRR1-like protein [Varanus komodoensis]
MERGGEWGCSRRRRRRRRRRRAEEPEGSLAAGLQRRRLQEACSELRSSEFWDSHLRALFASLRKHLAVGQQPAEPVVERALAALEKLQLAVPAPEPRPLAPQEAASGAPGLRCVCYGIGSFSACVKARDQLALLLLLLQELEIPHGQCCVFDPVFSVLEIEVLRDLGLTVLQENEEGKRPIHEPTVFYMIHCGKALYNNLLWSNWSVEALSKMAIIGNSFRGIQERVPSRIFHKDYSYIAKVLTATAEEAFPPSRQYLDVFNDTSFHCFPLHKLRGLPPEIWKAHEEPAYSDEDQLEIIRSKQ